MHNRSSRQRHSPRATDPAVGEAVAEFRHQRQTYHQIARILGVSTSTVGRVLKKRGLNRLSALEPAPPPNRYEYPAPGDMLHLDTKKLGRFEQPGHRVTGRGKGHRNTGAGWECVHIAVDDHSRLAFGSIHPDETARSACLAMVQAVRYYAPLGIRFTRVLTDNGSCYRSQRFWRLCQRLG